MLDPHDDTNVPSGSTDGAQMESTSSPVPREHMTGIAVGGCCDLSTSAHHLIDKIGTEQGYLMAESTGMDIDDAISIATRLLKGRTARQVWRGYHKHAFARRCYADPSDANLAEQHRARKQHEDERTEREELVLARTFLAWRRGMG